MYTTGSIANSRNDGTETMSDYREFDPDGDEVVDREVLEHDAPVTDRSVARRAALQALYEIDSTSHDVEEVLRGYLAQYENLRRARTYLGTLVRGIVQQRSKLDTILQQYAPEWPIAQVAIVDRNILRIALYEMVFEARVPVGVAIDEAVELAKLFGAVNTIRFVNGVLGAAAENIDAIKQTYLPPASNEAASDDE